MFTQCSGRNNMRILFLSDDLPPKSFGGAGIIAFAIAAYFRNKGHEVTIITSTQDREEEGWCEYENIKVYKVYSVISARWKAYLNIYNPWVTPKVNEIIRQISPDITHAHNVHTWITYATLSCAKKVSRGVFMTAHDAMSFAYGKIADLKDQKKVSALQQLAENKYRYNPFRNFFIQKILNNLNEVFSVSDSLRNALVVNGIVSTQTIHNGIAVEDWQVEMDAVRQIKEKYDLKEKKVVLFGGRLSAAKGAQVILNAMALVVRQIPNAQLLIVGQKNEEASVMIQKATTLGIVEHISFTGWIDRSQMKHVYASADLAVVASLYLDPFPTVNLEAMATRLPVVGTCFGGTSEIVIDGVTGYIVNPNEIGELSKKIVTLLSDDALKQQFGDAGYDRVADHFSLEKQCEELLLCYNKILNQ